MKRYSVEHLLHNVILDWHTYYEVKKIYDVDKFPQSSNRNLYHYSTYENS